MATVLRIGAAVQMLSGAGGYVAVLAVFVRLLWKAGWSFTDLNSAPLLAAAGVVSWLMFGSGGMLWVLVRLAYPPKPPAPALPHAPEVR